MWEKSKSTQRKRKNRNNLSFVWKQNDASYIRKRRRTSMDKLKEKVGESLTSVLPVTMIVLFLSIVLVPVKIEAIAMFLVGAVLLIIGMGFFQLGAEMSMTPLGQGIGGQLVKKRKLPLIICGCFLMGTLITISEPDLQVLANQVASIPNSVLVLSVAIGVGLFLVAAVLRILYKIPITYLLIGMYLILLVLAMAAPSDFLAVAFDAGGVTTGPMTVPFIMALGIGLSASRSDKNSASDSFGLIALSSVGPVLMVLVLGIFYHPTDAVYTTTVIPNLVTMQDVVHQFVRAIPQYAKEVIVSMLLIIAVFVVFQVCTHKYHRRQLLKMSVGFGYTIIGLILFLTGVNVGFAPVGNLLGEGLAAGTYKWLTVPIGMLIGYYIVKAEPAVQILNRQVEDITGGMISSKQMNQCLSIGVACAVGLAMLRALTGIAIYWILIPGYVAAFVLSIFVPQVFVGIAFDSGGVASGPMTSTFLLPLSMGVCTAVGGNVVTDAFGVIALVALAPLIAIQIMGIIYKCKMKKNTLPSEKEIAEDTIIELEEESL
ncbi:hypothetical protein BRYFOR_06829 [Marvinbryantia formatexigens DSM 14469]|uniref:DUF1538 domain-containing protein n=2 Tax=Marvinbryantia TaxID=248744 RepID=C6LDY0_9FIRM|nr:hypothetical protein BRYFOR_06829 [Marvinbryantia formatexigens DSM 14469]